MNGSQVCTLASPDPQHEVIGDGLEGSAVPSEILSAREVEILALIAEGYSSMEVANKLFVSKRTVDFHLSNSFRKLGASNRIQAIIIASRMGFVPGQLGHVDKDGAQPAWIGGESHPDGDVVGSGSRP